MPSYKEQQFAQWTTMVQEAEKRLMDAAPGNIRAEKQDLIVKARGLLAGIDAGLSNGKPTAIQEDLLLDTLRKI